VLLRRKDEILAPFDASVSAFADPARGAGGLQLTVRF
jgi:hypothetical protein